MSANDAASTFGGVSWTVLSFVVSVQFVALTSGVSVGMSDSYRSGMLIWGDDLICGDDLIWGDDLGCNIQPPRPAFLTGCLSQLLLSICPSPAQSTPNNTQLTLLLSIC
jgi:hypothetical protein